MIEQHYGVLSIDDALHTSLEALLNRYTLPENAERLVLNCRQMSYYRHRQGLHPIEVQFKRESTSSPWLVVFFASFSYPDDNRTTVEPELYFHLANRWCYQPDVGSTDLSHPEVQELLSVWMKAFAGGTLGGNPSADSGAVNVSVGKYTQYKIDVKAAQQEGKDASTITAPKGCDAVKEK